MFIQYDEFELLEIFGSEPINLSDEEAGIFMYIKEDDTGFKLILTISTYEKECNLSLNYSKFSKPIFESDFKNVEKISVVNGELKLMYSGDVKAVTLYFKPNFAIFTNDV